MLDFDYRIVRKGEHYEVYIDGLFRCSTDTFKEATEEVEIAYERMTRIENEEKSGQL